MKAIYIIESYYIRKKLQELPGFTTALRLRHVLLVAGSIAIIIGSLAALAIYTNSLIPPSGPSTVFFSEGATLDRASPAVYLPGESVGILFSLANYQSVSWSIASTNGCIFSFQIRVNSTEGPLLYDSLKHGYCIPDSALRSLGPKQTYSASMTWNQISDSGAKVPDGEYEVMTTYANWTGPAGQVWIGRGVPTTGNFYFDVSGDFSTYSRGVPVRIGITLASRASGIVQVGLSTCSFSYVVLNSAREAIYNSTKHTNCTNLTNASLVAPQGGLYQIFYWDQFTDVFPMQVPPGTYIIVAHAFVFGGTNRFDFSKELWPIQIA